MRNATREETMTATVTESWDIIYESLKLLEKTL